MRYTIKVEATLNGKTCKNPQIEFVQGEEFLFPCKIEGSEITLELRPGYNPNACIEGYIKCEDECLNCPPQHFKVCLCNDVTLLEACQVCKDGFIEDLCSEEDLLLGKICTPNGCQCPPNKPVEDPNTGQCVQCITGTTQGCKVCVGGSWEDITCGENERCFNGGCDCTEGYVRDPFTKLCVPTPSCTDDSQCDECEYCSPTGCQPIVCPEGYKCYKGECVYWPCSSTSCENGADCGPECGCVVFEGVKQCVPCHILECEGLCKLALGCKCNPDTAKCEGVGDCNQYCDGNTPCLDENCTCYNNRCVKCSNFPCPDDCANHYNCGCSDTNTCDGGKGCNDNLDLKKIENCPTECALEATYTTQSSCGCDPIEFRIKNTNTCNLTGASQNLLTLNTEIFKNGKAYKNYLDELTIGDDELVQATLRTTIVFYKKDLLGRWVVDTTPANATSVADVSAAGNIFDNITITTANVGFPGTTSILSTDRKVAIQVRAVGVKVPANDCIKYTEKVIGEYELDFSNTAYCAKINSYKEEQKVTLNDNASVRRPLFVWSKSTTSTYLSSKFPATNVYNASGWFRKEYGEKTGTTWKDKINKTTEGLLNNYNYKVTVDCGCKSNVATLEKVVFCCPKEFMYSLTNCGRTITLQPFSTCDVNKELTSGPTESQTVYFMTVNGVEVELAEKGNLKTNFTYTADEPITTILFEQRYKGTPLVAKACPVEYTETPDLPPVDIRITCNPSAVEVYQNTSGTQVASVTGTKDEGNSSIVITYTKIGNKWVSTVPGLKNSGVGFYDVFVNYVGGCVRRERVEVTCQTVVDATPTKVYAQAECPNGTNPDVVVTAKDGFTSAAEFKDPRDGAWYVADTTSPEIKKTFTNFAAGTYVFDVREGTKTGSATVEIKATIKPLITKTDICGTNNGSIIITAGAPNSQWRVSGPAYPAGQNIQLNAAGAATISIAYTSAAGQYSIQFVSDSTGATCATTEVINIAKDGGVVNPQVTLSQTTVCQGNEVSFKISDGGANLTYNVSSTGGIITDLDGNLITTLTASTNGGYNAKIRATGVGSVQVLITGIVGSGCSTLGTVTGNTLTVNAGPVISFMYAQCSSSGPNTYDVYVTVVGTVTSVNVAGTPAVLTGGVYIASGLTLFNPETTIATATNSATGCVTTQALTTLPSCTIDDFCPPPSPVTITTVPVSPTCGGENVSVLFNTTGLGIIEGEEFVWSEVIGGNEFALLTGTIDSGTPLPNVNGIPNLEVFSTNQSKFYKLRIVTNGVCNNDSDLIEVVAGSTISPVITGPITGVMTGNSYNYFVQDIPGATYTWTLTNTNGSNQPVGTNSSSIVISTFAAGSNTINVTVTNGACTGTASLVVTVDLNCPQSIIIQPATGTGDNSCKDLTYVITNGTSITSHRWLVDGSTYQSGGSTILNLDMSEINQGDTVDVVLEITFADGCIVSSNAYEYTRCSCICNANKSCLTTQSFTLTNSATSVSTATGFSEGKVLLLEINPGVCPDNLKISAGATVLLDLGATISGTTEAEMNVAPGLTDCTTGTKLNGVTVGTLFIGDEALVSGDFDTYNLTYLSGTIDYGTPGAALPTPCDQACGSGLRASRTMILTLTIGAAIANTPLTFENLGTITGAGNDPISKGLVVTVTCD